MTLLKHPKTYESLPMIWTEEEYPRFELVRMASFILRGENLKQVWRIRSSKKLDPEDFKVWVYKLIDPDQICEVRKQPEIQIGGYWQSDKYAKYDPLPFYEYFVDSTIYHTE